MTAGQTEGRAPRNEVIHSCFTELVKSIDRLNELSEDLKGTGIDEQTKAENPDPPTPSMADLIRDLPEMINNSMERISALTNEIRELVL